MHPYPTGFAHKICIRQMRILAGSITPLLTSHSDQLSLLLSVGWEMCISYGVVAALCDWEGNC